MNFDDLKLKNQLCHRLYVVSNKIVRNYRPFLKELDLTYPQYITVLALLEQDAIPVQSLQCKTKIDAGSLSLILDKLKCKGYICCDCSKEDKRKKIVTLTEKGKEIKNSAMQICQTMKCSITGFDEKDSQELSELLDKFEAAICKDSVDQNCKD